MVFSQSFEWQLPTRIIFGHGRFASTHKFVRGLGKRALIITSKSFLGDGARSAILADLLAQLRRIGVETGVFGEIEPNPRTTTIDRGAAIARQLRPRYVLALGGGSVMDAAKCIALLAENDGDIYQYAYRGPGRPMTPFNHALPIVCVPTIAATGSETDFYAVVTHWEDHKKVTVFGPPLLPTLSIIDPELTYSVPIPQTVDGAFDMITHVMESYLSTPAPSPIQDRMTEAIVETVVHSLRRVLIDPKDSLGRSQLSWCAALALSGVLSGRDGAWPIHALEHGLSAWTDVSHGRGLSLILPRMMDYDLPAISEKLTNFNRRIFQTPDLQCGFFAFMKEVGAWTKLSDIVPANTQIHPLVEKVVDHALEIKGILKRGEEPYLDNIRPLNRSKAIELLFKCDE